MIKPNDLFVSKIRIEKFASKAITSLNLLIDEVKKEVIDLDLIYDYSREAQGYLNLVHQQIIGLGRLWATTQGMAEHQASTDNSKEG
jgi:hypothetical protein